MEIGGIVNKVIKARRLQSALARSLGIYVQIRI